MFATLRATRGTAAYEVCSSGTHAVCSTWAHTACIAAADAACLTAAYTKLIQNVDSQGIMQRAPATQQRAPQQILQLVSQQLQQFARLQPMQYAQLAPQQLTKDHSRQITQNASASQQLTQRASPADAAATAATAPAKKLCHLLFACQPATYTMQSRLLLSSNQRVAQRGEIESKPLTAGTQQQLQLAAETAMTPKQLAQLISAATGRLSQPAIAPQLTKSATAPH